MNGYTSNLFSLKKSVIYAMIKLVSRMKNFDLTKVLKVVFLIIIIPFLFVIKFFINQYLQDNDYYTIMSYITNALLFVFIVLLPFIVIDEIKNSQYKKHNIVNPEARKISWIIIMIVLIVSFILPYFILVPFTIFMNNPASGMAYFMMYFSLLFFFLATSYKIMREYNQYGKKIIPNRKVKAVSNTELLASEISEVKSYQKMLIFKNHIIVINEAGIFEFVTYQKKVKIVGNVQEDYVYINGKKQKNPFVIKEYPVYYYFILDHGIHIQMSGIRLVTKSALVITLEKHLNKKIYTKEQIDKMYYELEVKYGNYENKVH